MISLKTLARNLFKRSEFERNLSEELTAYADLLAEEKINLGKSPAAARREALLEIGGIEQVKEEVRSVRTGNLWDSISKDLQQSVRSLRKSMGASALAIGTFALGLGATTLIFGVFYSVLLQPLPFRDPERLVQLWETRTGQEGGLQASFTAANFWDVRARNRTFESMAAFLGSDMNLTGNGDPAHLSAAMVSAQFFHVLGVAPVLGHDFDPNQDQPGRDNAVVLLSNKLWNARFASSRHVLGKSLYLNGQPYTVIGVLPKGEPWLNDADIFVPLVYDPKASRSSYELSVVGRLKPDVSIAAAKADLQRIARDLSKVYREDQGMGIRIAPSATWGARPALRRALWVLLCAVGFLLLIACVNIANLLLAKASARSRELRVREALGASRGRIIRLVLTESLLLGSVGALLGLLIAYWGLDIIRALNFNGIPHLADIRINGWVLLFTLLATLLSGVISGLMPALQSSSGNIAAVLREADRTQTAGRRQTRLRSILVMAEVALSMILLIGAGLLIRSFDKLLTVDRGFQSASRVIAAVNIPFDYDDTRAASITRRLLERVRTLPGVQAAGSTNSRPIVGWDPGMGFGAPDSVRSATSEVPWASWRYISTGYFRAMGIPLLRGRSFRDSDYMDRFQSVVISQAVADFLWPHENPIGRHIMCWKGQSNHSAEVIGVAGDIRDHGLQADPTRIVYIPFNGQTGSPVQLIVHTASSPGQIASSLRSVLASIDPKIPISNVESMDELINDSLGSQRLNTTLLAAFALIALLLSMSGIYGVLTYSVTCRISEIGIRIALGADPTMIFRLIVRQGMLPVAIGAGIGLGGAFALTRLLAGLLFDVNATDPASYIGVILLMGMTALLSCLLPARRALRVDPVIALRGI